MFYAAVLTVSDRSFRGERPDEGGPLVARLLEEAGYAIASTAIVPDEQEKIESVLRELADAGDIQLLVTTGGTGFAPRDVTPEATLAVCQRMTPGIPGGTLFVNLPGSPKAAKVNLEAVLPALAHGLEMLSGRPADCAKLEG